VAESESSRVKRIFGEVLDALDRSDPSQADALLASVPNDVRVQIQALVDAHSRASGKLLEGAVEPLLLENHAPQISGYQVGEEIGRGGFGIVYRGHQRTPIDRDVAIKVLRRELISADAITRFRSESTLLARMSHASIARVFDAGLTEQGQPFVAMELIEAQPLHRACSSFDLTLRQRVRLMADVCDAIQHAHQRAVIHRDLKPANILVEKLPDAYRPRVIDFGIAKLLEEDPNSPHTRASVRLGTPKYMSPEQRTGGDTGDTRVDVYALGAILCELIAGDVPTSNTGEFSGQDSSITRPSKIASEQTGASVASAKSLRGDLDRIVLKACADDQDIRYASAQAMGEDLRRYLNGLPVSASPPGVIYLSKKFVSRHRASVSLAGVLGIALVVTMAVAVLQWREARIERDKAQASSQRVAFIGDFLLEMLLLSADSDARGAAPILTESEMQSIADRARDGLSDDPQHMLPMLVGIGRFQHKSGYPQMGADTVREALDFAIGHHGVPSEEVVELRLRLHDLLWGHGLDGWKEQIKLADAESAELFSENDPRRLRIVQRSQGTFENLKRIIGLYETMPGIDPADHFQALFALGMKQRFSQTPRDQLETNRKLYEVAIANYPPDHSSVINAMAHYGDTLTAYAPSEEAAEILKSAYDKAVAILGYDHFTTESIRRGLARIYGKLGRPEEGVPYALAALESIERAFGVESIQYANALMELGRLYQYAGELELAQEALSHSLRLKVSQWSVGHPQITSVQISLAQVELGLGHDEAALALCLEARPYLQELRHHITYSTMTKIQISVARNLGDDILVEGIELDAERHLTDLGLTPDQIKQLLD
jgi:serine/threonine protein kinase/tetratricopeptide (TPR) repeat protein